jgi:purine-binding chemotaxis protein CheW
MGETLVDSDDRRLPSALINNRMNKTRTYCTFLLNGRYYGVPVERVQEVLRQNEMTRVPLAPREIRGLINLRGQIVTVIGLRERLNLPDCNSSSDQTHVVVQCDSEVVSFLVDSLGDVRDVVADQFELPPDTLHGIGRELIAGTYKMADDLLIVLSVDKVADIKPLVGRLC